MRQMICKCPKGHNVWTLTEERTREKQPAHEVLCPVCKTFIAGLERDGYLKITATCEDSIEEGPNPFFPGRGTR